MSDRDPTPEHRLRPSEPEGDAAGVAGGTGPRASLRLLRRNRDFRRLFASGIISLGGDWFLTVALFDLALEVQGSAVAVALVIIAQEIPFFLLSPLGGILADRLGGARVTIGSYVGMGLGAFGAIMALREHVFALFLASFLLLFISTGLGNGSTYRMIPAVFAAGAYVGTRTFRKENA